MRFRSRLEFSGVIERFDDPFKVHNTKTILDYITDNNLHYSHYHLVINIAKNNEILKAKKEYYKAPFNGSIPLANSSLMMTNPYVEPMTHHH